MKKVTFLIPPSINNERIAERVFGCTYGVYPIPNVFILTYAALLRQNGNSIKIIDAPIEKLSLVSFMNLIKKDNSDIYVFYCVNLSKELDKKITKMIYELKKEVKFIFMGPAATAEPELFLVNKNCYSIRGEGDFTLLELVDFWDSPEGKKLSEIKGITYGVNNPKYTNYRPLIENLDLLPFPARDLIDINKYFNPKLKLRPFTAVLTSRGCPYKCTYCVPCSLSFARKLAFNKEEGTINKIPKVAKRSAENIIEEFIMLKKTGYRAISILDDEFILDKKRTIVICEGIKNLDLKWGCLARADYLTDNEVITALAKAGCQYIDIGVESFDQEILDDIKKNIKVETFYEAIILLKKHKIQVKLNILFGASPLETIDSINNTIKEVKKLKPDMVMFGICNPFPGTEFYEQAKKEGWMIHGDYIPVDVQKESIIEYPHLSKEQLQKMVKKANLDFFLNPRFIIKSLIKFRSLKEFYSALKSLKKKLTGWGK